MDDRYINERIAEIWHNLHKLQLWEKTELAVMLAMVSLGEMARAAYAKVQVLWKKNTIDIVWWKARDKEIYHDLNAFIDERIRHLPKWLHKYVHKKITSFDTQEPAFARMLLESLAVVDELYDKVDGILISLARLHRYTIMIFRTHGQGGELKTFGARVLTWRKQLRVARQTLKDARKMLKYSKISGAGGNYGDIDPELEKKALKILGFKPFYAPTQIMPRIVYAPVASALCGIVCVLNNIAVDIRLGARSGLPIVREPFKKKQKGSSAMPHKKNPVLDEQIAGMARMAEGYQHMIMRNIETQEERAIEQSCVERVAWPDLFHVVTRSLSVMHKVLFGLKVYPENMLREIYESRGTYASSTVKEFLKKRFTSRGFGHEDAYRIVQLACFNVFELSGNWLTVRETIPESFGEAEAMLKRVSELSPDSIFSIERFIPLGLLRVSDELEITEEQAKAYNECLRDMFSEKRTKDQWRKIFTPEYQLKNEAVIYCEELGE